MLVRGVVRLRRRLSFAFRRVEFVPLPEKAATGGEDAYVSMSNVQAVLDGVSWWRNNAQVDAGLYSAALARRMHDYVDDDLLGDSPASSYRLLDEAYTHYRHLDILGTCTALVATLQERQEDIQSKDGYKLVCPADTVPRNGPNAEAEANTTAPVETSTLLSRTSQTVVNPLLDIATIGDCTCVVIRAGQVIFATEEQSHELDYPFQIGSGSKDTPQDALRLLVPVQRGDVVVMGSDGVFDNLYINRIVKLLWPPLEAAFRRIDFFPDCALCEADRGSTFAEEQSDTRQGSKLSKPRGRTRGKDAVRLKRTAVEDCLMAALDEGMKKVMSEAILVSHDVRCDSPYASKCIENGALYEGGKPDDMTLLAAILDDEDDQDEGERFVRSETLFPMPYRDWP